MLSEMRRQITEMLRRSHSAGALPGDDGVAVSTIGDDEVPKNKSTSTTKVSHTLTQLSFEFLFLFKSLIDMQDGNLD